MTDAREEAYRDLAKAVAIYLELPESQRSPWLMQHMLARVTALDGAALASSGADTGQWEEGPWFLQPP